MSVLLDSVILIDHFNDQGDATAYLQSVHGDAFISVVTRAEVLVGFVDSGRWERAQALIDAFQAALAMQHDLHLATRNTRDFNPGVHPFVIVPYRL